MKKISEIKVRDDLYPRLKKDPSLAQKYSANIDIHSVKYLGREFKDIRLRVMFYEFHDELAEYQILPKQLHRQLHRLIA